MTEKTWLALHFRDDLQQVVIIQSQGGASEELDLRRDDALSMARAILAFYGLKSDST